MTNAKRLSQTHEMRLPGFPQVSHYGGLAFHVPRGTTPKSLYANLCRRVEAAMGKHFLPIYRMADGEFGFLVGWKAPRSDGSRRHRFIDWIREAWARIGPGGIRTCWGESYRGLAAIRARAVMRSAIRAIAREGVVAAYFARRGDHWGEQYLEPVWQWFDANGIALDEDNYAPFYTVYALLSGRERQRIFSGRRILVATSLDGNREHLIRGGLEREGASEVTFLGLSASSSMFDAPDVTCLRGSVDVALVAAGIGSANVLYRLKPLQVPTIDCGMFLECLMRPERRTERPFLLPEQSSQHVPR